MNKRLLILAMHIEKLKVNSTYSGILVFHSINNPKDTHPVFFHKWPFLDMKKLFPKYWKGDITIMDDEILVEKICEFLGLEDLDYFLHLFGYATQWPSLYGGEWLKEEASPQIITKQIREFLSSDVYELTQSSF